jgi:hypothetical protein
MYQPYTEIVPGQILCTILQAARTVGRGQRWVYEAMADGRLKGVKSDGRTLIVVESIRAYAAGLPPVSIKPRSRPLSLKAQRKRQQKALAR